MEIIKEPEKYSADGPFQEPLVRCDSCVKLILVPTLHKKGMCPHCGNTRMRNIRTLSEEEMTQVHKFIKDGEVDQEWVDLFKVSE